MIDTHAARVPLTVRLPAELVSTLQALAAEKQVSLDDVVMEACLEYAEPHGWERDFKDWQQRHATGAPPGPGSNGPVLDPAASAKNHP